MDLFETTQPWGLTGLKTHLQDSANPEIRILSSKSGRMIYCPCSPSRSVCKGAFYNVHNQRVAHKSVIPSITLCLLTSSLLNITKLSLTSLAQIILWDKLLNYWICLTGKWLCWRFWSLYFAFEGLIWKSTVLGSTFQTPKLTFSKNLVGGLLLLGNYGWRSRKRRMGQPLWVFPHCAWICRRTWQRLEVL